MKKRLAIDINDVIRNFSVNFSEYYIREINKDFDETAVNFDEFELNKMFPFDSDEEYREFVYEDYHFELFGKCPPVEKNLPALLTDWLMKTITELDIEEDSVDVLLVSPMEYALTIQSTYFFLAKIGCRVREVYMPVDSSTIWDKCDALITANPKLLRSKPEDKITIKMNTKYNTNETSDFQYDSLLDFISNGDNLINDLKLK